MDCSFASIFTKITNFFNERLFLTPLHILGPILDVFAYASLPFPRGIFIESHFAFLKFISKNPVSNMKKRILRIFLKILLNFFSLHRKKKSVFLSFLKIVYLGFSHKNIMWGDFSP